MAKRRKRRLKSRFKKRRSKRAVGFRKKLTKKARDRVHENYDFVLQYLLTHPCVGCGEKDIIVLEFDHIDPKKKKGTISQLLDQTLDVVKREIDKCQILCSNCHRRRTAKQFNWKRRLALSTGPAHACTPPCPAQPDQSEDTQPL